MHPCSPSRHAPCIAALPLCSCDECSVLGRPSACCPVSLGCCSLARLFSWACLLVVQACYLRLLFLSLGVCTSSFRFYDALRRRALWSAGGDRSAIFPSSARFRACTLCWVVVLEKMANRSFTSLRRCIAKCSCNTEGTWAAPFLLTAFAGCVTDTLQRLGKEGCIFPPTCDSPDLVC